MNTLCGYRALDKEVTLEFLGIHCSFFPKSQKCNTPCRNSCSQARLGCSCSKLSFEAFPWNFLGTSGAQGSQPLLSTGILTWEFPKHSQWGKRVEGSRICSGNPQAQKCGNSWRIPSKNVGIPSLEGPQLREFDGPGSLPVPLMAPKSGI